MTQDEEIRKTKVKDLKYMIPGTESVKELIQAVIMGFVLFLVIVALTVGVLKTSEYLESSAIVSMLLFAGVLIAAFRAFYKKYCVVKDKENVY